MQKVILFIFVYISIFITGFAQRIIKSAINQYPSFNTNFYHFEHDYKYEHTFVLSDKSIVTLSADQPNFFVTKWSQDLVILDQSESNDIKNQTLKESVGAYNYINYYSCMINDIIYVFAYEIKDYKYIYYYYKISCKDKISIEVNNNSINGYVIANQDQYVYMMNTDKSTVQKINIETMQSEKIMIDVQDTAPKLLTYHNVKGYVVLTYRTKSTAEFKDASNSIIETFVFEIKSGKINKISIDFLLDRTALRDFNIAVNNDSIYFVTYSNIQKPVILQYKLLGYDFSLNTFFLQKVSSLEFATKSYYSSLATLFFSIDPKTNNLILILDRGAGNTSYMWTKDETIFKGPPVNIEALMPYIYKHLDYQIIYMNVQGNVLHTEFVYWPKTGGVESQSNASLYPKILVVDGLIHFFISSYSMGKTTCYVYKNDGTVQDQILLFDKDVRSSDNVNTATVTYVGNDQFVLATIPNQRGKTGSYYMFKLYK